MSVIQVSAKKNKKTETCWSEAEIPSEAKLQRGTLKTETLVIGISDCGLRTSIFNPQSAIHNQKNPASVAGERGFFTAELQTL